MIEASGDREAIDAYNRAVKAVKRNPSLGLSALVPVEDSRRFESFDNDWETAVRRARARRLGLPDETEEDREKLAIRAADATSLSEDEHWGKSIKQRYLGKNIAGRKK